MRGMRADGTGPQHVRRANALDGKGGVIGVSSLCVYCKWAAVVVGRFLINP